MKEKIKVLNLYAGIGGNRKLWPDDEIEVTAIEYNPKIAKIYQDFFPNDKVIVGDAHEYLLKYYTEYDFIWSSPPCITHSRYNLPDISKGKGRYPDMKLHEEIIFLTWNFKGKFVVENVISYYKQINNPKLLGRHYYWSNFNILKIKQYINEDIARFGIKKLSKYYNIDLSKYKMSTYKKRKLLRNVVNPKHGLHIFKCAFKETQRTLL